MVRDWKEIVISKDNGWGVKDKNLGESFEKYEYFGLFRVCGV